MIHIPILYIHIFVLIGAFCGGFVAGNLYQMYQEYRFWYPKRTKK